MKSHGWLFMAAMIRALLENRKGQTRRLVTANNSMINGVSGRTKKGKAFWDRLDWSKIRVHPSMAGFIVCDKTAFIDHIVTPIVQPGDEFWARETWYYDGCDDEKDASVVEYLATHSCGGWEAGCPCRDEDGRSSWRSPLHMPRWASRISGPITAVRGELLQSISPEDAVAEGIERVTSIGPMRAMGWKDYSGGPGFFSPVESYLSLWDSLAREPGTRSADNPPVWAYSFESKKS